MFFVSRCSSGFTCFDKKIKQFGLYPFFRFMTQKKLAAISPNLRIYSLSWLHTAVN